MEEKNLEKEFLEIRAKDYRDSKSREESVKSQALRTIDIGVAKKTVEVLHEFLRHSEKAISEQLAKIKALEEFSWLSAEDVRSALRGYNTIKKNTGKKSKVKEKAGLIKISYKNDGQDQARYAYNEAKDELSRTSIWRLRKILEEEFDLKIKESHGNRFLPDPVEIEEIPES